MPTLNVDGVALHVRERGAGETVLLLHSAGNTGAQWDALGSWLENDFRLLAPDLYDCGDTADWSQRRAMTYDDAAALLAPLLLQGDPVHLVGHSFGGGVALRLAAAHPDSLRTLTLIEPGGYQLLRETGREDLWLEFLQLMERFRSAVARDDLDAAWEPFFDFYCSHAAPWRALPAATRRAIEQKTPHQLRVYEAQASNPTRLSDIRRLPCPTLVIHGEATHDPERVICELVAANAPRGRGAEVPGAGHMAPVTHAQQVARLLLEQFGRPGGR